MNSIDLNPGIAVLLFFVSGLAYALFFKRPRASMGMVFLLFFAIGGTLQPVAAALGFSIEHDIATTAFRWLPWNILLLALLPAAWPVSLAGVAVVIVLSLQLFGPLIVPLETWAAIPSLNQRLAAILPGPMESLLLPIEPLVMMAAALVFFARWQLTQRTTEVSLSLTASLLLVGVMRPEIMVITLVAAAAVVFLSVVYNSHRMAFVDALTGLSNRRSLDLAFTRPPNRYAIAMLDIDRFKRINDRFGHDLGDQVLRMVASRLKQIRGFKAYRYGGEEFCLMFSGRNLDRAEELCEAARASISHPPLAIRGHQRPAHRPLNKKKYQDKVPALKITVSVGLARSGPVRAPEELIQLADQALYKAKRGGRDKLVVHKHK